MYFHRPLSNSDQSSIRSRSCAKRDDEDENRNKDGDWKWPRLYNTKEIRRSRAHFHLPSSALLKKLVHKCRCRYAPRCELCRTSCSAPIVLRNDIHTDVKDGQCRPQRRPARSTSMGCAMDTAVHWPCPWKPWSISWLSWAMTWLKKRYPKSVAHWFEFHRITLLHPNSNQRRSTISFSYGTVTSRRYGIPVVAKCLRTPSSPSVSFSVIADARLY